MQAPKFDALVSNVDKASKALEDAESKLNDALTSVDVGHVFQINDLPHHVVQLGDKKKIQCMFTKRQIAALRGEPLPPVKSRKPRTPKAAE